MLLLSDIILLGLRLAALAVPVPSPYEIEIGNRQLTQEHLMDASNR